MGRTTTEVIQSHLMKRLEGDLEGDIQENFSPDVIILSSYGTFKGHDGIRESAARLAEDIGEAQFAYNHTQIEGDYALLEWSARHGKRPVKDGADSFVVRSGKIVLQTIHYSAER